MSCFTTCGASPIRSQTPKELERDGLVLRREYLEVPVRVEYGLSEQAKKLQPILMDLIRWDMEAYS